MPPPVDLDTQSNADLKRLVLELLGKIAELERQLGDQRAEVARLKGLKGKPRIKPSGLDMATPGERGARSRRRRGQAAQTSERVVREDRILCAAVPAGSRFKGYQDYVVQDLDLRPRVVRFRRERWVTPDGRTVIAPLPPGLHGHLGADLRRFVLLQYHQGQTTIPRLADLLCLLGLAVSKRQVVRLLNEGDAFVAEAGAVLRAGLETARWITVDDTGARHKAANGTCTQLGDDRFTAFVTTTAKSRLNFLEVLRAGHGDYVINDAALAYLRRRGLPGHALARLAGHADKRFADLRAWEGHLRRLGFHRLKHSLEPMRLASEGALWGSIQAHGLLRDAVIVSDDAGQFDLGDRHALCWVHAERLVHRLDTFTAAQSRAQQRVRARIWWLYADLKAYRRDPAPHRKKQLRRRFDRLFGQRTGFVTLDRLLARLRANKADLLRVLERPVIPLHTNASENDLRAYVTRRKVSGGTRSDAGRAGRDAFLGLMKTCAKLGISFWVYLGARLGAPDAADPGYLPDLVRSRAGAT